jgi:hypothetical protein
MKVLISILLIACVVSASFVALRLFASSTAEHQTIYVEPSYVQVTPCTNFTVRVRIRDVTDLYVWQFKMTFDPNLMQCLSVTEGEFLRNVGPTIWPGPIIDNSNGWIYAGCSLITPPGASGGGVLAYVTFHCKAEGNSTLNMDNPDTYLLDSNSNPIPRLVEPGVVVQQEGPIYRYKAKFEYGWQSELVGTHFPSLNVPVETFTITHINVYNPNDFPVHVIKYFVKVWPEKPILEQMGNCNYRTPYPGDGRTCHIHIDVPERKGFEIDAEDILSWPPDPDNPIQWLVSESFWKGFVIIECPYELEVVAVYDKVGVDVVNKITFHIRWPTCQPGTYHPVPPVPELTYNTLYYVTVRDPPELASIEELVRLAARIPPEMNISIVIPFEPDIDFDFLECVTKMRIPFILQPPISEWYKFLDYMWPPDQRPPGWVWPDWFKPCTIREQIVKIRSFPHLDPSVWETFWSMGDVNHDGYINYKDLDLIWAAYGSYPGHPNWNPDCDLNKDLVINTQDVTICARNQGNDIWTYSGMPPQEAWGRLEKIRDPEKMVRENLITTLIELGVPSDKANAIIDQLDIEITEVDVAEGVGTSIDVEYIEPEIVTVP